MICNEYSSATMPMSTLACMLKASCLPANWCQPFHPNCHPWILLLPLMYLYKHAHCSRSAKSLMFQQMWSPDTHVFNTVPANTWMYRLTFGAMCLDIIKLVDSGGWNRAYSMGSKWWTVSTCLAFDLPDWRTVSRCLSRRYHPTRSMTCWNLQVHMPAMLLQSSPYSCLGH